MLSMEDITTWGTLLGSSGGSVTAVGMGPGVVGAGVADGVGGGTTMATGAGTSWIEVIMKLAHDLAD